MIGKMSKLTPLLKAKADELFLQWFLMPETQRQLQSDFYQIRKHETLPASPSISTKSNSSANVLGTRPASPPATPPLAVTPPGKSALSPRRRTLSTISQSSQSDGFSLRRNSSNSRFIKQKKKGITPGCAKNLPQFFFPFGRPGDEFVDEKAKVRLIGRTFAKVTNGKAALAQFNDIVQILGVPLYWKYPLFASCGGSRVGHVTFDKFASVWESLTDTCHDQASRLFKLMCHSDRNFLRPEDFTGLVQDVIETHPGLGFLQDASEFHSRYVTTVRMPNCLIGIKVCSKMEEDFAFVISRIFYSINRSWSGRISLPEFRRSNFQQVLISLEEEDDINQILDYFSYEHFYVIYCKFWELDTDHDLIIDKADLSRYNNGALSSKIVDRIFSGCVTRGQHAKEGKMTYADFVWFLISEVDKKQPASIEYWFRCMDLDGDGIISMYEMEYFYTEQLEKMQRIGIETLAFPDCLCLVIDMVNPKDKNKITLHDLKNCKNVSLFFDTFFNLDRWLEYEQRDPFQASRDVDEAGQGDEPTDWEKFAMQEYEILVTEEGASQDANYEDDFEFEDDLDEDDVIPLNGKGIEQNLSKSLSYFTGTGSDSDSDDGGTFY